MDVRQGPVSDLDPQMLLQAYAGGIFPMAESRTSDELFWVEPRSRAVLPMGGFHCSRSLARRLRSGCFKVTANRDFGGVITGCADRPETWINGQIERAMHQLQAVGHAHSVEVWEGTELVGGIYGVALGVAFFGESMFSRRTDSSKVALAWMIARLKVAGFTLFDCQFMTDHLASLGAVSVPRKRYVALLGAAVGTSTSGSGGGEAGVPGGASAPVPGLGANRVGAPEFGRLDRLLEAEGLADDSAASGKFITQLLGQTS